MIAFSSGFHDWSFCSCQHHASHGSVSTQNDFRWSTFPPKQELPHTCQRNRTHIPNPRGPRTLKPTCRPTNKSNIPTSRWFLILVLAAEMAKHPKNPQGKMGNQQKTFKKNYSPPIWSFFLISAKPFLSTPHLRNFDDSFLIDHVWHLRSINGWLGNQ